MISLRAFARGSQQSLRIEVGPFDAETGRLQFGMTAVVNRYSDSTSESAQVEQGSIGSVPAATARVRATAYMLAIEIAEKLDRIPELDNKTAADLFDGQWYERRYVDANGLAILPVQS